MSSFSSPLPRVDIIPLAGTSEHAHLRDRVRGDSTRVPRASTARRRSGAGRPLRMALAVNRFGPRIAPEQGGWASARQDDRRWSVRPRSPRRHKWGSLAMGCLSHTRHRRTGLHILDGNSWRQKELARPFEGPAQAGQPRVHGPSPILLLPRCRPGCQSDAGTRPG